MYHASELIHVLCMERMRVFAAPSIEYIVVSVYDDVVCVYNFRETSLLLPSL